MSARDPLRRRTARRPGPAGVRTQDDGRSARGRSAAGAERPGGVAGAGRATPPSHAPRPGAWQRLGELTPSLARAYDRLALEAARAGPLDARQSALLKVALSVGRGSWRGTHAHARKAMESGVPADALRHVACLALPVLGLAAALDALRWIEEIIEEHAGRRTQA
jgi:alkylhydroperoxidase/carboxymuconolactone decarboxylase family protein YurZ